VGLTLWRPWSLRAVVTDLAEGRTTPDEVLAHARARITETEHLVKAWVALDETAGAIGSGPLAGVPLGVKDIIDLVGFPTRCGSALRAEAPPATVNAAIVDAWLDTGVTPLGKTVTTEFAFFAPGPTHNPAEPGHTPGGSSSGSAAAVAAGHVPLAIGSQTAGSVTRPASFCGVASLVMTRGRFPTDGVVGLSESLDSHGVYAASVSDVALAWSVLAGEPDVGADLGAATMPAPRLLLWTAAPLGVVTDEMAAALSVAATFLRTAGATVEEFPLEDLIAEVTAAHAVVMAYEAARERSFELSVADQLSTPLASLLRTGAATKEADYALAQSVIAEARRRVTELLATCDGILGAAAPGPAPAGLGATGDPVLSRAWQALGLPALAVPGLRDPAGMPLGLQLIGTAGGETAALAAAVWVEAALGHMRSRAEQH
jgi:Asp-tRNA(Asn)/Glu-tRNA(Gln) amidotransferase A subunit family amidase